MNRSVILYRGLGFLALPALAGLLACGGGSSSTPSANPTGGASANVNMLITDAPSDSWADIGVIVRGIWLVPQGQPVSAAVLAYDGSKSATQTNLVQLDDLAQLLASASIAPGTYDRAIVKIDPNPANITLAPSLDAGGNPQNAIPAAQIHVNGTQDANGWVALPTITLQAALVAASGTPAAVNLDFDLANPLSVVVHDEMTPPIYTLNFVVRHKPQASLDRLVLHRNIGTVTATSTTSTPNTFAVTTLHGANLTFNVDATNGTLFYNLDATPVAPVASKTLPSDFAASSTTPLYAKMTSRFQSDGSLWAVRVWYSATESKLPTWTPEGHVVRVNTAGNSLTVLDDNGQPQRFLVDANTQFFFQGGSTAIGTGTAFLANIARGFKVQISVADATQVPQTASTIDIQRAVYDGILDGASASGFSLLKVLWGQTDTYGPVGYANPGFTWWNFAYPTTASTDVGAFVAQANATAGPQAAPVVTTATTTLSPGVSTTWQAQDLVFLPSALSAAMQTVSTPYSNGAMGITYTAFASNGTPLPGTALTVLLDTTAGSQPVVRQYSRSGNVVTVTDVTSDQWAAALASGAKVRCYGIPNASGQLVAYVVNIFN